MKAMHETIQGVVYRLNLARPLD